MSDDTDLASIELGLAALTRLSKQITAQAETVEKMERALSVAESSLTAATRALDASRRHDIWERVNLIATGALTGIIVGCGSFTLASFFAL